MTYYLPMQDDNLTCLSQEDDHSGVYVPLAEVEHINRDWIERCRKFRAQDNEEYQAENQRLRRALEEIVEDDDGDPNPTDVSWFHNIARKALEVK